MIDVYYRPAVYDTLLLECVSFNVDTVEEAKIQFYQKFGPEYIITRYKNPVDGPISCYKSALERYRKKKGSNASELEYYKKSLVRYFGYTEEELKALERKWFPKIPKHRKSK